RLRDEYEWREVGGEDVSLRAGKEWTILEDPIPGFRPSPLHRTIFVRPLEAIAGLRAALGTWLPRVECVGMGPWPDAETARSLAATILYTMLSFTIGPGHKDPALEIAIKLRLLLVGGDIWDLVFPLLAILWLRTPPAGRLFESE